MWFVRVIGPRSFIPRRPFNSGISPQRYKGVSFVLLSSTTDTEAKILFFARFYFVHRCPQSFLLLLSTKILPINICNFKLLWYFPQGFYLMPVIYEPSKRERWYTKTNYKDLYFQFSSSKSVSHESHGCVCVTSFSADRAGFQVLLAHCIFIKVQLDFGKPWQSYLRVSHD